MRDSALKLPIHSNLLPNSLIVGEELMRDSALKLSAAEVYKHTASPLVGEELMRDSALKPSSRLRVSTQPSPSEKSSCATAL